MEKIIFDVVLLVLELPTKTHKVYQFIQQVQINGQLNNLNTVFKDIHRPTKPFYPNKCPCRKY